MKCGDLPTPFSVSESKSRRDFGKCVRVSTRYFFSEIKKVLVADNSPDDSFLLFVDLCLVSCLREPLHLFAFGYSFAKV